MFEFITILLLLCIGSAFRIYYLQKLAKRAQEDVVRLTKEAFNARKIIVNQQDAIDQLTRQLAAAVHQESTLSLRIAELKRYWGKVWQEKVLRRK